MNATKPRRIFGVDSAPRGCARSRHYSGRLAAKSTTGARAPLSRLSTSAWATRAAALSGAVLFIGIGDFIQNLLVVLFKSREVQACDHYFLIVR